jgi:hypothetical protein
MHTQPVSELDGKFLPAKSSECKCKKCGSKMTSKTWESSCGGFEDIKYSCSNVQCGYYYWIEGIDS